MSKMLAVCFVLIFAMVGEAQEKANAFLNNPSKFQVEFGGAVVHVFGNIDRAVAIGLPLHTALLVTSMLDAASQDRLEKELGLKDKFECADGLCVIAMKGLKIRLAPSGQGSFLPYPLQHVDRGTFDLQVPHLQSLALDKANHPFKDVSNAVKADYPTGEVLAIFDYKGMGGELKSEHHKCVGTFEPNPGFDQVEFSSGVTLTGFTTTPAVLLVSSAAHTSPVQLSFQSATQIVIGFGSTSFAPGSCRSHLAMHKIIAYDANVRLPDVRTAGCICWDGLAPGCSNTQWP